MRRPTEHRGLWINGPSVEADVLGCNHCSASIRIAAPIGCVAPTRYRCGGCDRTICEPCARKLAETHMCVPIEKNLEACERLSLQLVAKGT